MYGQAGRDDGKWEGDRAGQDNEELRRGIEGRLEAGKYHREFEWNSD